MMSTGQCPLVSVQLNYLDRLARRHILINTDNHTIEADLVERQHHDRRQGRRDSGPSGTSLIRSSTRAILEDRRDSLCTLQEGIEVMHLIHAVERSATREGVGLTMKRICTIAPAADPRASRTRISVTCSEGRSLPTAYSRQRPQGSFDAIAVSSDSPLILDAAKPTGPTSWLNGPRNWPRMKPRKIPVIQHCVRTAEQISGVDLRHRRRSGCYLSLSAIVAGHPRGRTAAGRPQRVEL